MKYYKHIISMLIIVLATITGCDESVLEQENPNIIAPSNFWNTEEDAKKGIIGAYSPFTNIWYYTRFEIFLSDYRDDVVNGYDVSERTAAGNFNANPGSNGARWVWSAMFQGVSRANEVLFNVPNIEMDQTVKDNILGEAHFIRAFNYFNLLNYWLNVPLFDTSASQLGDSKEIPQAPPEEIRNFIIEDLKMAKKLLPATWSDGDIGRATSMSATALLGKVYLYNKDWALAKTEFQEALASPNHGLMDDYRDNFRSATENNRESFFEIQFKSRAENGHGGWGADNPNSGKGASYFQDLAPDGFTGQDGFEVNRWALDLFLDEQTTNGEIDPRAFVTFFWDTDETTTYKGDELNSSTFQGMKYKEAYDDGRDIIYCSKHLDFENGLTAANDGGWHNSGNNLRIIRYSDVLLMLAEAEFNLNGSSAIALDAINQVRRRVDMPEFTSITEQDIRDERVKELTFERTRYYDLLRWGIVKERIVDIPGIKSKSGGVGAYQPGREYIAIPQEELNRSNVFDQNTGWE